VVGKRDFPEIGKVTDHALKPKGQGPTSQLEPAVARNHDPSGSGGGQGFLRGLRRKKLYAWSWRGRRPNYARSPRGELLVVVEQRRGEGEERLGRRLILRWVRMACGLRVSMLEAALGRSGSRHGRSPWRSRDKCACRPRGCSRVVSCTICSQKNALLLLTSRPAPHVPEQSFSL